MKKLNSSHKSSHKDVVEKLIEVNLELQKKDVELLHNLKNLVERIDRMLNVFEEASKHVMEVGEDKKILNLTDKLNDLLEQNKTIAKGLLMLEKYVRTKSPSMM